MSILDTTWQAQIFFFVASHTDIFFKDNDNIKMYRNFFLRNEYLIL